ncbi:MAG: calcium/sodium antiporter [Bacteroidaceae bacterium]|nr:calcium/sodium antiporter [Bacteroidaceae bacterium]
MLMNIVLLLVGTALVLWGADKFTDGACGVARRWNVSELVIGLTIVAMGTSLPELIVSLLSSIRGSGDMSVGNIVGSNIFNTLVIIGASAMAMKIAVSRVTLYRDVSLSFGVAVVLFLMGRDGELTRLEGALLLGVFACFLYNLFAAERKNKKNQTEAPEQPKDIEPVWKLLLFLVIGVASLVGGGQLLVNNAAELARSWGVSESVIGLTILAGGTSLPELATSVVAARKGSNDLALGNALGSNIFNITLVLGLCNVISPMHIPLISTTDWAFLIGSNVVLAVCAFTRMRLCRLEGFVLLLCYAAYLTLLFSV